MKAVILAAGRGSRLGHLSENTPKSMLQLNSDHTLLSFNFKQLSKSGIDSIILVTGYNSKKIEEYALNLSKKYDIFVEIVYNPFWNHCNVLGSLYLSLEKIEDDFIFLHADTLSEIDVIQGIISSKSDICLAVDFKPCGEEEMKFWLHKDKITRITKVDIGFDAQGEFVGIAKFSRNMLDYFSEKSKEIFQSGELNSYMEEILDRGLLAEQITVDYFDASVFKTIEVDFMQDLDLAKKMFKEET
jgi:L-glutamine-phosphate cytidylyltransferase